ncbi:MAG: hypothetical protein ABFS86_02220 [Planctomycetota bacterium]
MSTRRLSGILIVVALFALSTPAMGQAMEIFSGQKAKISLGSPGGFQGYRFEGIEGDALTLKVAASKKTSLDLVVRLFGPTAEIAVPEAVKGKITIKKLPLPETGTYFFVISGEWPTIGDCKMSFKLKRAKFVTREFTVPGEVAFTAPHGSLVTATIKAPKGSNLEPGVDAVLDIMDDDVLVPATVTEKGGIAKIRKLFLPGFSEYRLVLSAREGAAANATVKLKIKPPKAPEKKIGKRAVPHSLVTKVNRTEEGISRFGRAEAQLIAMDTSGVDLRFPPGSDNADLALTGFAGTGETPGTFMFEEYYDTEGELDAAFPDGLYTLRLTRGDASVFEIPIYSVGPYPSPVEITDLGSGTTPAVTWTGGDGAMIIVFSVLDEAWDLTVFHTVLSGTERSFAVPDGIIQSGREYEISVRCFTGQAKAVLTKGLKTY